MKKNYLKLFKINLDRIFQNSIVGIAPFLRFNELRNTFHQKYIKLQRTLSIWLLWKYLFPKSILVPVHFLLISETILTLLKGAQKLQESKFVFSCGLTSLGMWRRFIINSIFFVKRDFMKLITRSKIYINLKASPN